MDLTNLTNLKPDNIDINKILNDPNIKTVECKTVFGPNTPIYVDGQIITMTRLHIGYSGKETKTVGVDPESKIMKKCGLIEIPKEVYIENVKRFAFGPGLDIECAPFANVLLEDGYKTVNDLKLGDKLLVTKWNSQTGVDFIESEPVTDIFYNSIESHLKTPMYAVLTEFNNIFIPFPVKGSPIVWIINFQQ